MWPSPPFEKRVIILDLWLLKVTLVKRKLASWWDRQTDRHVQRRNKEKTFLFPSYSVAMSIPTKSLQHVNAPLGIKMLILKEKKSSCGLIPFVLHSLWGELSSLWFGQHIKCALLQSSGSAQCFRCLVFLKVTPVLQSWYLKWIFWAGFRPLSSHPVNSMTLVARGTLLVCSPNICSVPGEAFVAHGRLPHSTSKGSWARRQLGLPSQGRAQTTLHPQAAELSNSSCAGVATLPCGQPLCQFTPLSQARAPQKG